MKSNEKIAYLAVYGCFAAYADGVKREKILDRAINDLICIYGLPKDNHLYSLADSAFDKMLTDGIISIIPYSEMTDDQKRGEDNFSGVFYRRIRELKDEEIKELKL